MPVSVLPPNPKITIILRGLFISWIHEGMDPARIGLLSNAPNHKMEYVIYEVGKIPPPPTTFSKNLHFVVTNPTQPGVQLFHASGVFDRANWGKDFRWAVDLERDVFTNGENVNTRIIGAELGPFIDINTGVFYTSGHSPEEAVLDRDGSSSTAFGHVADSIAVAIEFTANTSALLTMDGMPNPILDTSTAPPSVQYIIDINRDCDPTLPNCGDDFRHIYTAVNIPFGSRTHIRPKPPTEFSASASHDVPCLLGNIESPCPV